MDLYLIMFISLLLFCFIGTIVVSLLFNRKQEKERKLYLSKERLEEYESLISSFLAQNNIEQGLNIAEIVDKLGYRLEEKDKLANNHEAEKLDKTILVDKTLSYRAKNFGIAHEVAHIVKGDVDFAARDSHSFKSRSIDEQVCDYIAAALLLPCSDMKQRLEKANYNNISRKERIRFISALADEKNVSEEVVIRRINEVKTLVVF